MCLGSLVSWVAGVDGIFQQGHSGKPHKKVSDLGNAQIDTFFSVGLPSVIE